MAARLGNVLERDATFSSVWIACCGVSTEAATVIPDFLNVCIHLTSRAEKSMLMVEPLASTVGAIAEPSEKVDVAYPTVQSFKVA